MIPRSEGEIFGETQGVRLSSMSTDSTDSAYSGGAQGLRGVVWWVSITSPRV